MSSSLFNDNSPIQLDSRKSLNLNFDAAQQAASTKQRSSFDESANMQSSAGMKKSSTHIPQFSFEPKSDLILEIESYMPLYIDCQSIDAEYLQWCFESLKQKQLECSLKNDVDTLNFIQQRLQVLVYQNPLPQISEIFRPLLLEQNCDEQRISRYFLNEDFPSIIQLQHIIFSNDHSQPNAVSQKISDILKRNSDQLQNSKQLGVNNNSSENLDISTETSTDPANMQDSLSAVIKEELHKQKVYSTDNINLEDLQKLLTTIYNTFNGRIPNIFRPFLFFPEYLKTFFTSFEEIFIEPSAWPYESLYQIAMMTASAYECSYVFLMFGELYQIYQGNPAFLEDGFEALDPKVKKAWDLIYLLKKNHSAQILNQQSYHTLFNYLLNQSPAWNQNELIFAFLSISFAQQLVILSHGMGLVGDNDSIYGSGKNSTKPSNNNSFNQIKLNEKLTHEVIEILTNLKPLEFHNEENEMSEETDISDFEFITSQINQTSFKKYVGFSSIFSNNSLLAQPSFNSICSPDKRQKSKRGRDQNKLASNVCDWKTHTSEFIAHRNINLSKTLNEKYSQIQDLTLRNFGSTQEIDTRIFREAIWNFCEITMGYSKTDYNYKKMNNLLQKPFRNFLKKIIFKPHEIKLSDFNTIPYLFEVHDMVHVIFLASEAKFYTQNIFLFHSLSQFLQ
ncbi:hypothetical protein ABPG72_001971 [Tetrahymena utriculariae]